MQKAFTMLELIFVIIVIGILSAIILPQMKSNKVREAAIQLVSHIRYTQHLAMVDDKYDKDDIKWHEERWTIRLKKDVLFGGNTYSDVWAYSIFNDISHDRNPNQSEMARNPLNQDQYLSGGFNNTLDVDDTKSMKNLRLGDSYGITNIVFGGGCRTLTSYIHFDHLGRPMNSFTTNNLPYQVSPVGFPRLIVNTCTITLSGPGGDTVINIEPETGYAHIIDS